MDSQDGPRDPEELEAIGVGTDSEIPPLTRLGPVHLTVGDLGRATAFYRDSLGLQLLEGDGGRAFMGVAGRPLIVLVEQPGATSGAGYTGLYHVALLLPDRSDLARWLAHAARKRVALVGASDHFVSEALYLSDPDGHGLEIYWDRPRALWEGQVAARMTTLPLDIDNRFSELPDPASEPFDGLAPGAIVGHVHLRVSDVGQTIAFYRDLLGFGLMASLGSQAAFLSAGGYHHHIGANIWESRGAPPPSPGALALRHATIVLPDAGQRDRILARLPGAATVEEHPEGSLIRDPSGNGLVLAVDDRR